MSDHRLTRRQLLQGGLAVAGAATLGGCERIVSRLTSGLPETIGVASSETLDPLVHLISRAGYGPRPGSLEVMRQLGKEGWIEQQLNPAAIDDWRCTLRARRFEALEASPALGYEFKRHVMRQELARHALLRAVYSERQLFEVMVGFWTDHFNIDLNKGDCIHLKAADEREVIRAHALGRFQDLVRASATSAAMLIYLDGNANQKAKGDEVPNENYARELLELHTLGVAGGYTQQDVFEAARALTGWRVKQRGFNRGSVGFDARRHDDGRKVVLGHTIPAGGGARDLERLVEIACAHPSTARHIATKLCRRLVADPPPAEVVASAERAFQEHQGAIPPVLRAIFHHPQFEQHAGCLMKRPFRFIASALRATAADTHARQPVIDYLERMGQEPYGYPTPDGYPVEPEPWMGTLLWRWNFAIALAYERLGAVRMPFAELARAMGHARPADVPLDQIFALAIGRSPSNEERSALHQAWGGDLRAQLACVLASPAFQRT